MADDPVRDAEGVALRTFSYGGGVQSTAALVLAAQGRLDFPVFLFANVGDDSEHPDTLAYVNRVAKPYAAEHGIALHELRRLRRDGSEETLWGRLMKVESRSLPIPVRMSNGAPGQRACTSDFKIRVIAKWLKAAGATEAQKAVVGVGISTDEFHRANSRKSSNPWEEIVYPLLDLGINRSECMEIIRSAGLPVPPKSSCFFCPFHRMATWQDMKRERPDLFAKSVELEATLNQRRDKLGKDHVWLTRFNMPLEDATGEGIQEAWSFDGPEECDTGFCFT